MFVKTYGDISTVKDKKTEQITIGRQVQKTCSDVTATYSAIHSFILSLIQ